jgi:hypothetical protein
MQFLSTLLIIALAAMAAAAPQKTAPPLVKGKLNIAFDN